MSMDKEMRFNWLHGFNILFLSQGWTYAVDFPAEYHPKKGFTSCVRRRKWVRYRRYIANDSWSAVPPIHGDPCEVPKHKPIFKFGASLEKGPEEIISP